MSMSDLESALRLVKHNPDDCSFVGPRDEGVVAAAEEVLDLPANLPDVPATVGAGDVGGEEIYGGIDAISSTRRG